MPVINRKVDVVYKDNKLVNQVNKQLVYDKNKQMPKVISTNIK